MADLDRMQLLQQEEADIQNRMAGLRRRLDINQKMQAELLDAVPLQPTSSSSAAAVVKVTRPKAYVPPARPKPVQPKPEVPAEIKPEILTKAAIVKQPYETRSRLRPPPVEVKQEEIVKQEPEEPSPSKTSPPPSPRPSKTSKPLSPRPSSPPPVEKARPRQPHQPRGPPPAELMRAATPISTTSKSSGLGQPRPSSTPTGATTMAPGTSGEPPAAATSTSANPPLLWDSEEDVDKWLDESTKW